MAESRDRLTREVDLAQVFAQRRFNGILLDQSMELLGPSVQRPFTRSPTRVGVTASAARGGFRRDYSLATPRSRSRRGVIVRRLAAVGSENSPLSTSAMARGRGRGSGSVLPSWYPRTPLRDITAVLRAIERRRARREEEEGQGQNESTGVVNVDEMALICNTSSVVQLEHNFSTPASTSRLKPCPPSVRTVSKILLNVANQNAEGSELITPQKKLLNSIDTVEKAVMEELQKMKRTPSAKKAERQQKVRTLMSMR